MKINVAYNPITLEVVKTTNSRRWLRRRVSHMCPEVPLKSWKFSKEIVSDDYFTKR